MKAYIHYLRDRSLGEGVVALSARKRKLNAEAELAEMLPAQARADVVSVEEVQSQWDLGFIKRPHADTRSADKTCAESSVETELATVKDIIEDGIFEALGERRVSTSLMTLKKSTLQKMKPPKLTISEWADLERRLARGE